MTDLELILVEDDAVDAMAVRRCLQRSHPSLSISVHPTGQVALEDPRLQPTADHRVLVLLDLNLPGMGGLELLRSLRRHRSGTELPVVVLTTSSDQRDHATAVRLGVQGYFIKPIDSGEMATLLAAIVTYWQWSLACG